MIVFSFPYLHSLCSNCVYLSSYFQIPNSLHLTSLCRVEYLIMLLLLFPTCLSLNSDYYSVPYLYRLTNYFLVCIRLCSIYSFLACITNIILYTFIFLKMTVFYFGLLYWKVSILLYKYSIDFTSVHLLDEIWAHSIFCPL